MKIFTFEFDAEIWANENQDIDPNDLDSDSFSTELAYSNLIIQEIQNPEKKIEIKNAEVFYLVVQLEFLLEKLEKQQKQVFNIKSMHQNFNLEFLCENDKIYLSCCAIRIFIRKIRKTTKTSI